MKTLNTKSDEIIFFEILKEKSYPASLINIIEMLWKENYDMHKLDMEF